MPRLCIESDAVSLMALFGMKRLLLHGAHLLRGSYILAASTAGLYSSVYFSLQFSLLYSVTDGFT